MRTLAIGDIHGCLTALRTLEATVPFAPEDRLITLGDYVNRGPDSKGVLDWLIDYKERGQLIAIRGNHEIMMLNARRSSDAVEEWLRCGGRQTLASYGGLFRRAQLKDIPEEHWKFLETGLRNWFEIETHFFVHANAYADCSLEDQPGFMLFWEHLNAPAPHQSGKTMICGHTPQISGRPFNAGHTVCLDTNACRGGWLTCLDVVSGQYWQANEQGQSQSGWLDEI